MSQANLNLSRISGQGRNNGNNSLLVDNLDDLFGSQVNNQQLLVNPNGSFRGQGVMIGGGPQNQSIQQYYPLPNPQYDVFNPRFQAPQQRQMEISRDQSLNSIFGDNSLFSQVNDSLNRSSILENSGLYGQVNQSQGLGRFDERAQQAYIEGLDRYAQGLTPIDVLNAKKVVLTQSVKNSEEANEQQITDYLNKYPREAVPTNLANVYKAMFPRVSWGDGSDIDISTALKGAVMKGFQTYTTTKGKRRMRLSTRYMDRPVVNADPYVRVVIRQARRLVKKLQSALSSSKMSTDKFGNDYETQKAFFNENRMILPSQKINKIKDWAKKYGTADIGQVAAAQTRNINRYINRLDEGLKARVQKANARNYSYLNAPYNDTAINNLITRIPKIRKRA